MNDSNLARFTDILSDEIGDSQVSQPLSLSSELSQINNHVVLNHEAVPLNTNVMVQSAPRPAKRTGQYGQFRSVDEIDEKYRSVFSYPFFNLVQSSVIEDALYSDKSVVICAPTGSGKTVVFEMAIVQLLMEIEDKHYTEDFKIIYMAPVKALCTERLTEWYPKFTRLGLLCIVITGDTDVDFAQLKPYRIIITTPEKWDMVTRRWREHRQLVEVIKLFLIDEVHILNDDTRGPVLEAVVSRMKTIESSAQSAHRIEQLQNQYQGTENSCKQSAPTIRFVAVSATVSNPEDVATWLGNAQKPAVYYKFGDEIRPVKLKRVVEGYPCPEGTSIFKFDIILNYRLWPLIQKYHNGKPTLIFCNTRKSVMLTAEALSRELTVAFNPEQKAKLTMLASTIKNKKLQALVLSGVGCHHAGLLFEERSNIENAFRNRDLPILITTTTLAMGVNLPAHLVIVKNTQQYVNGAYQEYSISTVLQMVGRAGRPQFDTEATAVIMTRLCDKSRYQALVGGSEPLQSYLHKRLAENLNSEAALGTVNDVAQCVQWVRSTFLSVRASRDPKRYLGLPQAAPQQLISKKIEELCVKAMNGLATSGLITMDDASCIESTEAGRLMSVFYLDLETMKHIMKINGTETLEQLLWIICESHELADMHLRVDERRCLNTLNRNNAAATIRFPMKGKISSRQMKLNCVIQAILGCLNIPDPSLNQEAMKIMRIADRVCKCLVAYVTRPALISQQPKHYFAVLNSLILAKCVAAHLWENSPYVSKQLRGIGPTFSTLLASAGKVNFMLLEESHPRDLERIMNKGPPAGNILRKQVSLLPKYQLTMTPVDEKTVTIQLALLNQSYLSENVEQLTAGDSHKSYLVVGDSENNLLLYTSFKDKDFISVYDGIITHQITRKNSFEHKVYANCISSSFVGIDAQSEYLFQDLEPVPSSLHLSTSADFTRRPANKQTTITDTFKERKRKNTSENDITQSKEKRKRDSAILEKIKYLKESFGKTSKELKKEVDKSAVMSNKISQDLNQLEKPTRCTEVLTININPNRSSNNLDNSSVQEISSEAIDSDDLVDDYKINSILKEIESEISKGNPDSSLPCVNLGGTTSAQNVQNVKKCHPLNEPQKNNNLGRPSLTPFYNSKKRGPKNMKSNYNFIDLLEKNNDLSDKEERPISYKSSGFSNTIKNQIEQYLEQTKIISKKPDLSMTELLKIDDNKVETAEKEESTSNIDFRMSTATPAHYDFIPNQEKDLKHSNTTNKKNEDAVNVAKDNEYRDIDYIDTEVIKDNTKMVEIDSQCGLVLNINDSQVNNENKKIIESDSHLEFELNINDTDTHDNQNLVVFDSHCDLKLNTNNNIKKPFPMLITRPTEKTCDFNNTIRNANLFQSHNLVPCKNILSLIPVINQNAKDDLSVSCLEETKAKSIIALPYPSQNLACLQNSVVQKHVINETNDMINSRSDLKTKPYFRDHTRSHNSNSKQCAPSAESNNNEYSNPNNQNIRVRKYLYSSTNIDVARRDAHVVIRKLKMDWDITEIISQDSKNYSGGHKIDLDENTKSENHTNVENNLELTKPQVSKVRNGEEERLRKDGEDIIKPPIGHGRTYKNRDFKDIQDPFSEKNNSSRIFTNSLPQFNLVTKQTEPIANYSKTKVNDLVNNNTNEANPSPQKEGNCVENILQKYSQILKKNSADNFSQNHTQPRIMDKALANTPSAKPKRPFKITDIHNFSTPLPKTLISETSNFKRENVDENLKDNHNPEDVMAKIRNEIEKNDINIFQLEPQQENFHKSPVRELWRDLNIKCARNVGEESVSDNLDGDHLKYDLPIIEIEDPEPRQTESMDVIDYNIDQSMLNPKTLLQCLIKDEPDIIPPPPEFGEEDNLIISPSDNDDLTVPIDFYEPMNWDNLCEETKESIFQDDFQIELTPKKEIETWTLSQNSQSYENYAASTSFNPAQSFTVMRNNSRQRNSLFQNVSTNRTRQSRLGQFKFCRKSKLLPKK